MYEENKNSSGSFSFMDRAQRPSDNSGSYQESITKLHNDDILFLVRDNLCKIYQLTNVLTYCLSFRESCFTFDCLKKSCRNRKERKNAKIMK